LCFNNFKSLPVTYRNNKKSWMTTELWNEWFENLKNDIRKQRRKMIMFVNYCTFALLITTWHDPCYCPSLMECTLCDGSGTWHSDLGCWQDTLVLVFKYKTKSHFIQYTVVRHSAGNLNTISRDQYMYIYFDNVVWSVAIRCRSDGWKTRERRRRTVLALRDFLS